jgi:tetratricopeptide (TPR) repeat protein
LKDGNILYYYTTKNDFSVFSMLFKVASEFQIRIYFVILLCLFLILSCNTYPQISFSKRIVPANIIKKDKSSKLDEIIKRYKVQGRDVRTYPVGSQNIYQVNYKRYYTKYFSFSPLANINNLGVDYALMGMYPEAETLFTEVIKEDNNDPSALNNLGIIYELNNNNKAFNMYSKACLVDSDNEFYRLNFLHFCDNKMNLLNY